VQCARHHGKECKDVNDQRDASPAQAVAVRLKGRATTTAVSARWSALGAEQNPTLQFMEEQEL
jgi:hypothetical protein